MMLVLMAVVLLPVIASQPIPIIIDTDVGSDFDDSWAIALALARKDLWDVKMILTATGNTAARAQIVAKYLQMYNRTDIPIGVGVAQRDGSEGHLQGWAADVNIFDGSYSGVVHFDGVAAAVDLLMKEDLTFVAIAPVTNFLQISALYPHAVPRVKAISAMFGAIGGKEYNCIEDPEASHATVHTNWPLTINPIETCGQSVLKGQQWADLKKANTTGRPRQFLNALLSSYCFWGAHGGWVQCEDDHTDVLFDPTALFMSTSEAYFNMETLKLIVDPKTGQLNVSDAGHSTRVAKSWTSTGLQSFLTGVFDTMMAAP